MTTDNSRLDGLICRSNLAKNCHGRDVRQIQESGLGLRNEGVHTVGKLVTEANIKFEELKQAELPDISDPVTGGPHADDLPIVFRDRETREIPTRHPHATPKTSSRVGHSVFKDSKASTCEGNDEKDIRMKRPKGFRKEMSGIAQELLELRLHMIKEEELFKLQEQSLVIKQVQRGKTPSGAPQLEGRPKPEKLKGQVEQRRKHRSPLKNQTNLLLDDLKGKVSALLKQRREMREQDRLLRLQLDEMRAQWEESVQEVKEARSEKSKILIKIVSIMG